MTISSWPVILAGLLGILAPHVTDFLTKKGASDQIKSAINLGLSTLIGVLVSATTIPHDTLLKTLAAIGTAWVMSLATHYADPLGTVRAVENSTARFGIGSDGTTRTTRRYAGIEVKESDGPAPPPRSPGLATHARQSKVRGTRPD